MEDFYSNLVRAIHAEMLHKGSSKQGRRKSKKRKNGKSMQHQTSTLTSNDNEDDDDDEDVDDIRTNSNGKNFIFNGNESQEQVVHPLFCVKLRGGKDYCVLGNTSGRVILRIES